MNILQVFFWYCKHMGIMADVYSMYQDDRFGCWKYNKNGSRFIRISLKDFLEREYNSFNLKEVFWSLQRYRYIITSEKYKKARYKWKQFIKNNLILDPTFIKVGDKVFIQTFEGINEYVLDCFDECGMLVLKSEQGTRIVSPYDKSLKFENNEEREPKFLIKKNRKTYGISKE